MTFLEKISIKKISILIFILALCVRLGSFAVLKGNYFNWDAGNYNDLAIGLAQGKGYVNLLGAPTAFRPPAYPFILSIFYRIFGTGLFVGKVLNMVMGSLLCVFIFLLGNMAFNKRAGLFAGLYSVFYYDFIFYSNVVGPEISIMLTNLLYILILLFLAYNNSLWLKCLGGLSLGYAALIKPLSLAVPAVIFIWLILKHKTIDGFKIIVCLKKSLITTGIITFFMVLTIAPWTLRNFRVFGAFVPLPTYGGIGFWGANNPQSDGKYRHEGLLTGEAFEYGISDEFTEIELSRFAYKQGWDYLSHNLNQYPYLILKKSIYFWNVFVNYNAKNIFFNFTYVFILFFSCLGLFFILRSKLAYIKAYLLVFYAIQFFGIYALFFDGSLRQRLPIEPYLILFGCFGIDQALKRSLKVWMATTMIVLLFLFFFILYLKSDFTLALVRQVLGAFGLRGK